MYKKIRGKHKKRASKMEALLLLKPKKIMKFCGAVKHHHFE